MNLLCTGASGFIGSHFIERIIRELEVEKVVNVDYLTYAGSVYNTNAFNDNPKYIFEMQDIRNLENMFDLVSDHHITHVVHFAAESHVDRSIIGPDDFITTNINGTFNLLEAFRTSGMKKFLHISTDEVFGSISEGAFNEESRYAPNSPYSASKAASDHLVRAYHKTYGLPAIITHCSNNYGPRQHAEKFIPTIIRCCREGKPIPLYGDGLNERDWIYVKDHCEALWRLLVNGKVGESYNIGADNVRSNLEIIGAICRLLGIQPKIERVADRLGHDRRYAVDSTKIRGQLNWQPMYEFEMGLKATVDEYLKEAKC